MYIKKNARVTFRSNRRSNFKRNNNFSNNKPRNKGNVTQQYNKYLKLAKEAFSSGDRIQSEYYYQFTDHYYRIMLELGISLEENDYGENKNSEDVLVISDNINENASGEEKKDDGLLESESSNGNDKENNDEDDIGSIESVPFISKPVKKRVSKISKVKKLPA